MCSTSKFLCPYAAGHLSHLNGRVLSWTVRTCFCIFEFVLKDALHRGQMNCLLAMTVPVVLLPVDVASRPGLLEPAVVVAFNVDAFTFPRAAAGIPIAAVPVFPTARV